MLLVLFLISGAAHLPSSWHLEEAGVSDRDITTSKTHKKSAGLSQELMMHKHCLAQPPHTFASGGGVLGSCETSCLRNEPSPESRYSKQGSRSWVDNLRMYFTPALCTQAPFCICFSVSAFLHLQIQWD